MIENILKTITSILSGRSNSLLIPDLEKKVKNLIKDKERSEILLKALKELLQEKEIFLLQEEGFKDKLIQLIASCQTPKDELISLFDSWLSARKQYQNKLIQKRLFYIERLTEEEFIFLTDPKSKQTVAKEKELMESYKKVDDEIDRGLMDISNIVIEKIKNSENRLKAFKEIHNFKDGIWKMLEKYSKYNYRDNEIMKDYSANEEKLKIIFDEMNEIRKQIYTSFVNLYVVLTDLCSSNEWEDASKAIKKLIK